LTTSVVCGAGDAAVVVVAVAVAGRRVTRITWSLDPGAAATAFFATTGAVSTSSMKI
jgi:hypothetical protein